MKIFRNITQRTILAILAISIAVGGAVAAIILTQHFPSVGVTQPVLTSACTTLTASPATVISGTSPNFILFNCNGSAALTVNAAGTTTPTVSVGGVPNPANQISPAPGYVDLLLIPHVAMATSCDSTGSVAGVTTGISLPFGGMNGVAAVGASLDYCAIVNAPAPATAPSAFDVSWSQ